MLFHVTNATENNDRPHPEFLLNYRPSFGRIYFRIKRVHSGLKFRLKPSRADKNPGLLQSRWARVHIPGLISAGVSRVPDPEEGVSDVTG